MKYIDIVFDGPPDHRNPQFIEVEDSSGKSIRFGAWVERPERPDGPWALRIPVFGGDEDEAFQAALPRSMDGAGEGLSIVRFETDAGYFGEANVVKITDGVREALYVPLSIRAVSPKPRRD